MNDSEKLALLDKYIEERLAQISRFIYHYEYNIPEPAYDEQADYMVALGERRALMEILHKLREQS